MGLGCNFTLQKGETYKGKVLRHILPKPSEDSKEKPSSNLTNDNSAPNLSTKLNETLEQFVMPCQGEEISLEEKCIEPDQETMIDGMIQQAFTCSNSTEARKKGVGYNQS